MSRTNLILRGKAKGLDEASFIMRAQNGYDLFALYYYEENGVEFFLDYSMARIRAERKDGYVVTIRAGYHKDNPDHEHASLRNERLEFLSVYEAIRYLKEKENTCFSDWDYRRRKKF